MSADAYAKLLDYASRARQRSQGLPAQKEADTYWSGIGFSLAGLRFVVPMSEVGEILLVPRYTQVPGVQTWVKGVANVRGRLLPVMDLIQFMNKSSNFQARRKRLLIIDQGELYSGLVVDEVFGMQHFLEGTRRNDIPADYHVAQDYLRGSYENDVGVWALFSMHLLAKDPRFLNVAS